MKPHEAASIPSLQCLYFQIIQPLFPKLQLQQPKPCRWIYSQSQAPKKALVSLFPLAQTKGSAIFPWPQSLPIPCIASQCLEIQTQLLEHLHRCATLPFSCLSPCCPKAGGHISGHKHCLSQVEWTAQDQGLPGIFPIGPQSS